MESDGSKAMLMFCLILSRGHSRVPVVEAVEQQSRYGNEKGLPASLVKEAGTGVWRKK